MKIWDRKNNKYIEEHESAQKYLEILYNTFFGRILLKTIFVSRWFSKVQAIYQRSILSKRKIKGFIKEHNVDMSKYEEVEKYKSFEEFFRRKRDVKKYIEKDTLNDENLVSIADSKLQVFYLNENSVLKIKSSMYELKDLIEDDKITDKYKNGICLVYRLSVNDYHRYHFLDEGKIKYSKFIKGKLHTIRPISEKYNVYSKNSRYVSILETKNFGEVIQIEVGAMLIGKIVNHECESFNKLDEKGFFDFGGSTIVQIFSKDAVKIDEDIILKSNEGIETKVEIGMKVGESKVKTMIKKS